MPVCRLVRSTASEPCTERSVTVRLPSGPAPLPWIWRALGQPVARNSMLPVLAWRSTRTGDDLIETGSLDDDGAWARAPEPRQRIPARAQSVVGRSMAHTPSLLVRLVDV